MINKKIIEEAMDLLSMVHELTEPGSTIKIESYEINDHLDNLKSESVRGRFKTCRFSITIFDGAN